MASAILACSSSAASTAFTALANSMKKPSPISLTIRPSFAATTGSMICFRRAVTAANVPASSMPIIRE